MTRLRRSPLSRSPRSGALLIPLFSGMLWCEEATTPPEPTPPVTETATGLPESSSTSEATQPVSAAANDTGTPADAALVANTQSSSDKTIPSFVGRAIIGAGYDSNALLLNETNEVVTGLGGAALSGSVLLRYRAIKEPDHRLEFGALAEYDYFTDQDQARQLRAGLLATWAKRMGTWLPGATLGGYRYLLDGEGAASVVTGSVSVNHPSPAWAALPSIEATMIEYDDLDIASGLLLTATYRHWFILHPGQPATRIEASLRVGTYQANEDFESYLVLRPGIEYRWRGDQAEGELAKWAFVGRAWYEYRAYTEAVPLASDEEVAHRLSIGGEADRRINRYLSAGGYAAVTTRQTNFESRDYNRFQIGLRLGANF